MTEFDYNDREGGQTEVGTSAIDKPDQFTPDALYGQSGVNLAQQFLKPFGVKNVFKYADLFDPLSDDLYNLLQPGAFDQQRKFQTGIAKSSNLGNLSNQRSEFNLGQSRSGLKSGAWENLGSSIYQGYQNNLSSALFDVETGIQRQRLDALSAFEDYKAGLRTAASQIGLSQ